MPNTKIILIQFSLLLQNKENVKKKNGKKGGGKNKKQKEEEEEGDFDSLINKFVKVRVFGVTELLPGPSHGYAK